MRELRARIGQVWPYPVFQISFGTLIAWWWKDIVSQIGLCVRGEATPWRDLLLLPYWETLSYGFFTVGAVLFLVLVERWIRTFGLLHECMEGKLEAQLGSGPLAELKTIIGEDFPRGAAICASYSIAPLGVGFAWLFSILAWTGFWGWSLNFAFLRPGFQPGIFMVLGGALVSYISVFEQATKQKTKASAELTRRAETSRLIEEWHSQRSG